MVYENNKEKKQHYFQTTVKESYYTGFDLTGFDS